MSRPKRDLDADVTSDSAEVVCRNFRPCFLCIALITKHTIFEMMPLVKSTLSHHPLDTLIVICMHEKRKREGRPYCNLPTSFLEINIDRVCATISRRFHRFGEATSPSLRRGLSFRNVHAEGGGGMFKRVYFVTRELG